MNRTDSEIVARVEQAITTIRTGRMVILVDDEDRENEGDLVMAAELVTPEADQLHGAARARPDLPRADAGAL
jgi:3,4-dihydroxy-2-butanone 4-phosphate synthase